MGLSDPVREALPHAVRAVEEILAQAMAAEPHAASEPHTAADSQADVQETDVQETGSRSAWRT